MIKEDNEINWDEIMEKFSSFDGSILEFCRENNISHHKLYYRRKKLREENEVPAFHAIKLNTEKTIRSIHTNNNKTPSLQDIRIEIGKVSIYIPVIEIDLVGKLLKELAQ